MMFFICHQINVLNFIGDVEVTKPFQQKLSFLSQSGTAEQVCKMYNLNGWYRICRTNLRQLQFNCRNPELTCWLVLIECPSIALLYNFPGGYTLYIFRRYWTWQDWPVPSRTRNTIALNWLNIGPLNIGPYMMAGRLLWWRHGMGLLPDT